MNHLEEDSELFHPERRSVKFPIPANAVYLVDSFEEDERLGQSP